MIFKKILIVDSCVVHDYKKLNEKIMKNHTSLFHQNEILKLLVRAVVCEKIDLINAYYQILMHFDDVHKTVFKTSFELYE